MRLIYLLILSTSLPLYSIGQNTQQYSSTDMAALKDLTVKWQHFWNVHNMDSMGTLLKDDVDFVNVGGAWLKGRLAVVKDHKQKHSGILFKNSVWVIDSISIKAVKPGLAIIHLSWGINGDNDPDGTPRKPRHGIFTWVVIKENNQWALLAVQNTNIRESAIPTK
jgi:uncharacterized protein (TIGR02246 family)